MCFCVTLISQKMGQLLLDFVFCCKIKNADIKIFSFHFFGHSMILSLNGYSKVNLDEAKSVYWEDPLEKGMAAYSSILAWRIPQTEEPDGLQPMGSLRVGQDWVTNTSTFQASL